MDFRNKLVGNGYVLKNKSRLFAQGYYQDEGIGIDETCAPVAHLESVRLPLILVCHFHFELFQIDVNKTCLNGLLKEVFYVEQPTGLGEPHLGDHVYKLNKAFYGLEQAPRAWYKHLDKLLLAKGFKQGSVDNTLFYRILSNNSIFVAHIYMDDIIFGSTSSLEADHFTKLVASEFKMSMVGKLSMFLGLHIDQDDDGMFISLSKHARNVVRNLA